MTMSEVTSSSRASGRKRQTPCFYRLQESADHSHTVVLSIVLLPTIVPHSVATTMRNICDGLSGIYLPWGINSSTCSTDSTMI